MHTAAGATQIASIDPTLLALLSILVGLLTIAAGFLGAGIQSRREHQKWVRERRYDAYLSVVRLISELLKEHREVTDMSGRIQKFTGELSVMAAARRDGTSSLSDEQMVDRAIVMQQTVEQIKSDREAGTQHFDSVSRELAERISAFELLGPKDVIRLAGLVLESDPYEAGIEEMSLRSEELGAAMRKALKIPF